LSAHTVASAPKGARFASAIAGVALAATLIAGAPNALAQDHGEQLRRCAGRDQTVEPRARIDSCSALIASSANTDGGLSVLLGYRAHAYWRAGDTRQALADLNEAIRLSPTDRCCWLYSTRGLILVTMGETSAAVEDFDRSVQGMRDRAAVNNQRCWGRAVAGVELDRARGFCDAALRQRPGFAAFLDSRGLVGLKQGRFQDAWNDYDQALRWAPDQAQYLYGRGIAARGLGRAADGEADIAVALRADPAIAHKYALYGVAP
jgi:tetratricopeptide (TPR) repeat protein